MCNHPPLPPPRTPRRAGIPRPDVELDLCDVLNDRLNRLRYGSITPNQEEKISAKRLSERQREIAQIPKVWKYQKCGIISTNFARYSALNS